MEITKWLQNLAETCRDEIPPGALAAWSAQIERWGLNESGFEELARRVMFAHRGGPLRFAEVDEQHTEMDMERSRHQEPGADPLFRLVTAEDGRRVAVKR